MARPRKIGLDYFPLDVDFFEDDKIQIIEAEFGTKGVIVAIRLLCKVYKNGYFYQWGGDECLLLSKQIGDGIVPNLVEEIVKGLVRRSFFDKGVFDSFRILTSRGIQRRYLEAAGRTRAGVEINPEIDLVHSLPLLNRGLLQENTGFPQNNATNKIKEKKIKREGETPARAREEQVKKFLSLLGPWQGPPLTLEFATRLVSEEMTLTVIAQQTRLPSMEAVEDMLPRYMGWLLATQRRHTVYGDFTKTFISYIKIEQKESSYGQSSKENDRSNATKRVCHRPEEYGEEI